ncbi:MAG: acyl-CoA/acyl-ACP dehydrogenase [Deltaproteobacteria bacterium]|nr:acyl-CoA/acyl-ACP dehydrogenase [Deltaproteobacteria bacterium]
MGTFFWWTDEHRKLAAGVKEFVDELMPRAEEASWKKEFPRDIADSIASKGYFGVGVAKEYGGMGLGVTGTCIVNEEIGRMPALGPGIFASAMLGGVHQVKEFGTEEQKTRFLARVAKGELGAIALTEPFVGTDAAGIETTARRDGDRYVISGKKRFVTGAGTASRYMLYARTSDEPEDIRRKRHLTGFIVEKGMPGFTVEKINELIGLDNIHNGYLNLDEVPVSVNNRIGDEGQGWQIMMSGLNYERLICASLAVGGFRELIRSVVSYGQRRIQFGQPTINISTNQFKIADMLTELKLAKLSTYYAAHLMDLGQSAVVEASISKLYGADMLMYASVEAAQVMGGDGVTKFYPLDRIMREAKTAQIAGGTSEAMKLLIYRMGLKEMADELKMPRRVIHEELGVPMPAAAAPAKQTRIDDDKLLKALAEDYRVNPGLYMSREDLKEYFDVSDEELDRVLVSLEEKKLVKLYRRRGIIELAKATYEGLNKANPSEYYRWFPSWVRKEDVF